MTSTLVPDTSSSSSTISLDPVKAFAAVALAAVSWDGVLTAAGSRALRHALDYREPYRTLGDQGMVGMIDELLGALRREGAQHLMLNAAEAMNERQRHTAYAVAAEIMRSDGPLQADESNILASLADALELDEEETNKVQSVMDMLHASLLDG
jgi:hypothetical protein